MFRAQTNQFDEAVVKATDENLTSENWALILDVCDRVSAAPTGPQSAVAALIKRLAHRNANVQIYTLELANALSQNCGAAIHRELASRSFTDALLRLAEDRNTHQQVKAKVLECMQGWTDMFAKNPDLGIMAQACDKLRRGNPNLQPPSKPQKQTMGDEDRRKEEEDLQMALALSLREKSAVAETNARSDSTSAANQSNSAAGAAASTVAAEASSNLPATPRAGTTAATVSRVRALYDFSPTEPGELGFAKGDVIAVLESVYKDWWKGSLRGDTGIFPLNYVEKLQDPTTEELERDAETEAEVFAQVRNVEKLLALLSVRGEGRSGRPESNEDEITELYHQTLAIRPKLIELIGKYSQKKDDFTTLNEKFIKARRDYEALLDSSMARPYGRPPHAGHPYPNGYGAPPPQQHHHQQQQHPQQQPYPVTPQSYTHLGRPQQMTNQAPYGSQPPQSQPAQASQPSYGPNHQFSTSSSDGTPAPFHFLPGGTLPSADVRSQGVPTPAPSSTPFPDANPDNRPQSIHTLNSGFPQELASGSAHEGPIPPTDHAQNVYNPAIKAYNPTQHAQPQPRNAYPSHPYPTDPRQSMSPAPSTSSVQPYSQKMPVRPRTESFETPAQNPAARQSYIAPQYQPQQQHQQPQRQPQQQSQQPYPSEQDYPQSGHQGQPQAMRGFGVPGAPPGMAAPPTTAGVEDDVSDYYR